MGRVTLRVPVVAVLLTLVPSLLHGATPAETETALGQAKSFLYSKFADGSWEKAPEQNLKSKDNTIGSQWGGQTALAAYALLAAGDNPNAQPKLAEAVAFLKQAKLTGTYALGIRCLVWARLPQTPEVKALMKQDAAALRALMKTQGPAKGFYDYDARGSATAYSLSRSQYAVLGMWAAAQNGVEVPTDYWRTITASWTNNQDASGGWAYQKGNRDYPVTPGMTAAGVATLYLAQEFMLADAAKVCDGNPATPAIDQGLKWLAENFEQVGAEQGYAREFPFPTLYAVERVGMASGRKYFGANDWHEKGADYLVKRQRKDGSWHNKGAYVGPVPDTCFGMLFLARGRSPVLMNKLEWGEKPAGAAAAPGAPASPAGMPARRPEWNQRPRDVANLAYWVSSVVERDLNWQVVDESASLRDWHDAPILYVSGTKALALGDDTKRKLREYVEGGGLVLGHADCAGRAFAAAFRKLGTELFPKYAWRELPADHPVFKNGPFLRDKWKTKPSVRGLSNGVRELMVLIPQGDPGRAWQSKVVGGNEPFWQLGADLFFYAAGRKDLRYRGENYVVEADPKAHPTHTIVLARVQYDGNWDPEPGGWRRLANVLHNDGKADLRVAPVALRPGALSDSRLAHFTGTAAFKLNEPARAELKRFVSSGGTLLVDAAGGSAEFARAAEAELAAIFPDAKLSVLPPDHPVYSDGGAKIGPVAYRPFAQKSLVGATRSPRVQGMTFAGGRVGVFFSREDLSAGLVGQSVDGIVGYEPRTSTEIVSRIILYAAPAPARGANDAAPKR
jgi:hypothetical protein